MNPIGQKQFIPLPAGHVPGPSSGTEAGASPASGNHAPINVNDLLVLKLNDPSVKLSFEESIALMAECIQRGEREATKAEGQDLIVLIGNTGAGKSTFGNYLSGCTMKRVNPKTLGVTGIESVIVVKSKSEGGPLDEIMPIGHSKQSMTFMPQIVPNAKGFTLCDCPGFLDNRGEEINIANAVNIKKAFVKAKSVKVVMLINYHTLKADRSRGLKDMIKISCDLFGSKENLIKYHQSLLLGITGVPRALPAEDEGEETATLDDLKRWIADVSLKDQFAHQTLAYLAQKVFIYDPLDNPNLYYKGAWNRETIWDQMKDLAPIMTPDQIFQTVLTPEDKLGLMGICTQIEKRIHEVFAFPHLTEEDFRKVAGYQKSLCQLEIIEHPQVIKLISESRNTISSHFKKMVFDFERHCLSQQTALSSEAETLLNQLKMGIHYFDQDIQSQVQLGEIEKRYDLYKQKVKAREDVRKLRDKERDFRDACACLNFSYAEVLLGKIKAKLSLFDTDYKETQVDPEIKIDSLNMLLSSAKEAHRKRLSDERKQNQKLAELHKDQMELVNRQITLQENLMREQQRAAAAEAAQQALLLSQEQERARQAEERARALQEQERVRQEQARAEEEARRQIQAVLAGGLFGRR